MRFPIAQQHSLDTNLHKVNPKAINKRPQFFPSKRISSRQTKPGSDDCWDLSIEIDFCRAARAAKRASAAAGFVSYLRWAGRTPSGPAAPAADRPFIAS